MIDNFPENINLVGGKCACGGEIIIINGEDRETYREDDLYFMVNVHKVSLNVCINCAKKAPRCKICGGLSCKEKYTNVIAEMIPDVYTSGYIAHDMCTNCVTTCDECDITFAGMVIITGKSYVCVECAMQRKPVGQFMMVINRVRKHAGILHTWAPIPKHTIDSFEVTIASSKIVTPSVECNQQ